MFEKVNPSHPDKVADRIAGALVDLAYARQENPQVAIEALIGHGMAYVIAESSVAFTQGDVQPIVDRIAGEGLAVRLLSIPQDSHLAANQQGAIRCGDNGIFRGCAPTHEQKLLTSLAHTLYGAFPTDGKFIITTDNNAIRNTICQSNANEQDIMSVYDQWCQQFLGRDTRDLGFGGILRPIINPLGPWTGGPAVDCGATNRKLGSDMGDGVTGGGLHGKDLSKADVSVNIWCYLESIRTGQPVTACCSIGDETVKVWSSERNAESHSGIAESRQSSPTGNGIPYADIVEQARLYIHTLGGFERFAEWGLIRHRDL